MINIYDVTFRVTVDAEGLVSIVPIRIKPLKFPDVKAEEFDDREEEKR